ncbi:MAG: peptidyl-prolyl cis-trans isomerase [bacterium]|nr:peptidyl-prolyl cis-trans isomerase [bacterium]
MQHRRNPNRYHLLIVIWLVTLSMSSATRGSGIGESQNLALAIVNEDTITARQLLIELGRIHSGQHDTSRIDFSVDRLISRMVNDQLILQDAKLLQLDVDSSFIKMANTRNLRAAIDQYTEDALPDTAFIPEDSIKTYYVRQYHEIHLFRLILRDQLQADSILTALRQGSTLEKEAEKYATEIFRYGGGDLGFRRWLSLDAAIQEQLVAMKPGEMRGPFPMGKGFALIRFIEEKAADSSQMSLYRDQITTVLKQRRLQAKRQAYFDKIKPNHKITVDENLLRDLIITRDSAPTTADPADSIIAWVDTDSITVKTLKNKIVHRSAGMTSEMMTGMKSDYLEELIEGKLLKFEALAHDYTHNQKVIENTNGYADSLLLMRYIKEVVNPQINVTDTAIDSFFTANRSQFHKPDQVKISQITTTTEDSSKLLLERLNQGADFTWIAQQFSIDDAAVKGGDKGWLEMSIFPQSIRDSLEKATLGSLSGPYQSMEGYVILKVTDRKPGDIYELPTVKNRIIEALSQLEFNRIMDKTLAQLKEGARITIDNEAIKNLVLDVKRGK